MILTRQAFTAQKLPVNQLFINEIGDYYQYGDYKVKATQFIKMCCSNLYAAWKLPTFDVYARTFAYQLAYAIAADEMEIEIQELLDNEIKKMAFRSIY